MTGSNDSYSKIIRKEQSDAFSKWELPSVSSTEVLTTEEELIPTLTAEQLEEIHQQAYQEGYQEGKSKGHEEGINEGFEEGKKLGYKDAHDATIDEVTRQTVFFKNIIKTLEKPVEQLQKKVEDEILNLSLVIAKFLVRKELEYKPEYITEIVKNALQLLPSSKQSIKIYLNPLDIHLVNEYFKKVDEDIVSQYTIIENSELERGDCIIDSQSSHIDETLESRFQVLVKEVLQTHAEQNQTENSSIEKTSAETAQNISQSTNQTSTDEAVSGESIESDKAEKKIDSDAADETIEPDAADESETENIKDPSTEEGSQNFQEES